MNAVLQPAGSRRVRFFFGLGMLVLPPFWAWWTFQKRFTARQRTAAFFWANLYVLLLIFTWNWGTGDRIHAAMVGYPAICGTLSLVLGLWLLGRIVVTPIELIVLVDVIAMLPRQPPYLRPGQPWWEPLLFPLLLVLLHLTLPPLRGRPRKHDITV